MPDGENPRPNFDVLHPGAALSLLRGLTALGLGGFVGWAYTTSAQALLSQYGAWVPYAAGAIGGLVVAGATSFVLSPSRRAQAKPPKPKTLEDSLTDAVGLGILLAALAPALYSAVPPHTVVYTLFTGMLLGLAVYLAVLIPASILRLLLGRKDPPPEGEQKKTGRLKKAAILAAGLTLGIGFGAVPYVYAGPIIEKGMSVALPKRQVRQIGPEFGKEVERILSQNPVGREVLERLRDRGGTVRLPIFFLEEDEAYGIYNPLFNSVGIPHHHLRRHGWTVEEFLAKPELQRELAADIDSTMAHELFHRSQFGRREAALNQILPNMEIEYEAFLTQFRYIHAKLQADPGTPLTDRDLGRYMEMLEDLDGFLKEIDGSYGSPHLETDYYGRYMQRLRAEWPATVVEGNLLLALRFQVSPRLYSLYLERARKEAAASRLPPPELPQKRPAPVGR